MRCDEKRQAEGKREDGIKRVTEMMRAQILYKVTFNQTEIEKKNKHKYSHKEGESVTKEVKQKREIARERHEKREELEKE